MVLEGIPRLSVVDDRDGEERSGRPRLSPAGRVLAEPPGNHDMKIGESTKINTWRPCLAEHGSIDSFNKFGRNFKVDNRDFVPGK